jgi:hypothetical protein
MAIRRVYHGATGSPSDGNTWTTAHTNLTAAIAAAVAGDEFWVASDHAEVHGVGRTFTFPGTVAAPNLVLSVSRADDTLLAGASISTNTNDDFLQVRGNFLNYGVSFDAGLNSTGGTTLVINDTQGVRQTYESLDLKSRNDSSNGESFKLGSDNDAQNQSYSELKDCGFLLAGNVSKTIRCAGVVRIKGGRLLSGHVATTLINPYGPSKMGADVEITGLDMSAGPTGLNITSGGATGFPGGRVVVRNCRLPASWSGSLVASAISAPVLRAEMYNCAAGDQNYKMWVEDFAGSVKDDIDVTRVDGASDGDTSISWKMQSSANAEFPLFAIATPEITRRFPGTEAEVAVWAPSSSPTPSTTVSVEVTHNFQGAGSPGGLLTDADIWLEVECLDVSGFPVSRFTSSRKGLRSNASEYPTSSETWTGSPTLGAKQTLSVTVRPQEKGYLRARVYLAKASSIVYVCPHLEIS